MAKLYLVNGTVKDVSHKNGTDFSLEELKGFVKGWVEPVWIGEDRIMVVNEEGKLEGLDFNVNATAIFRKYYGDDDFIAGNALVCKITEIK